MHPKAIKPAKLARLTGGVTLASWEYQNTIMCETIMGGINCPPVEAAASMAPAN